MFINIILNRSCLKSQEKDLSHMYVNINLCFIGDTPNLLDKVFPIGPVYRMCCVMH